jgi:phage FluMu protein Com
MPLPILPHEDFGADCCGCLVEIIGETTEYRCNECDAVIAPEEVQRIAMEMPSIQKTCPHCGKVNEIAGFSEVFAFRCRFCSEGVGL